MRTERIPFGVPKKKMNIDEETRKRLGTRVPRWINDTDTRIVDAQGGGYDFIENVKLGDAKEESDKDRRVRKQVGKNKDGSPKYAYLMAIPEKFYKEDQKAKEAINAKVDQAIKGGSPQGLQNHGVNPNSGGAYVKNIQYEP
jgi:hypothetical protein